MATNTQIDSVVRILLQAKDQASPEIEKVNTSLDKLGAKGQATGASMHAILGGSLAALTGILSDSARAAAEEEVGIVQLSTALDNAGLSYAKLGDDIEKKIAAQTKISATSDDAQRASLAQLVGRTHDAEKAFQLLTLAIDLSKAKGIDLATATQIVGKVYDGNVGILHKFGITVAANATAVEGMTALQDYAAGHGKAYGDSVQGSLDKQKIAIDNLNESLGGILGPLQAPIAMLPGLSKGVVGLGAAFGFFATKQEAAAGAIALTHFQMVRLHIAHAVQAAAARASAAATALFSGAMRVLNLVMALNPIGLVIIGVTALVALFVIAYAKIEPFRNAVNALWAAFVKLIGPLGDFIKMIGGTLGDALGSTAKAIGLVDDKTKESTKDMGNFGVEGAAAAAKTQSAFTRMYSALKDQFKADGSDEAEQFLKSLGLDEATINERLDALNDTVGASEATRFEKMTDVAYDKLATKAKATIMGPITKTLEDFTNLNATEQAKVSAAHGKSVDEYKAQIDRQYTDAEARLKHYTDLIASDIYKAREQAQGFAKIVDPHVVAVHALRDAWEEAKNSVYRYNSAIVNIPSSFSTPSGSIFNGGGGGGGGGQQLANGFEGVVSSPTVFTVGEAGPEYMSVVPLGGKRPGSGGNVTISPSITLNYSGSGTADASTAASMAADVIDQVTEALRQQSRRVGVRQSPFAGV